MKKNRGSSLLVVCQIQTDIETENLCSLLVSLSDDH